VVIKIDFLSILYLIGAAQGLFLAAALATKDIGSHIANKYLALFLLIFCLSLIDEFFFQSHYFYEYPHLIGLIWPLDFLYGPLFYFYLRLLTAVDLDEASRGKLKHFALFGVGILLAIPFWVLSGEQKLAFIYNLPGEASQSTLVVVSDLISSLLVMIQMLFYLVLCFRKLKLHQAAVEENFSSLEKVNLTWLRSLLMLLVILWALYLIDIFFSEPFGMGDSFGEALHICLVLIFYTMGYRGVRQREIFQKPETIVASPEPKGPKYVSSGLSKEVGPRIAELLQKCMCGSRPHLKNDLTLAELAEMVGVSSHHLSQAINEQLGKNFFDFINQFRVQEAKALLSQAASKMTVIEVAMESGFNSKTAFYEAFKKHTGMTPSQFRKKHSNQE
jgi:AraC-like DNA-binding protein